MSNLFRAHNEWANRPPEERYTSLEDMLADAYSKRRAGTDVPVTDISSLRVACEAPPAAPVSEVYPRMTEPRKRTLKLIGAACEPAPLSNYAFGQLCRLAEAPQGFLSTLSPDTAALVVNERMELNRRELEGRKGQLLHHSNGTTGIRSINGSRYARRWDCEILERIADLVSVDDRWHNPPAFDPHDWDSPPKPSGLYMGDRDMFAFMIDGGSWLETPERCGQEPIHKGFYVYNSEVGAAKRGIAFFTFGAVCGNHIIWSVGEFHEFSSRHVGDARDEEWQEALSQLRAYAEVSPSEMAERIARARRFKLGEDKEEVLEFLYDKRRQIGQTTATRKTLTGAWEYASEDRFPEIGDLRTAWGFSQALTRYSQTRQSYASDRLEIDRMAGRVIEMASA